MNPQQSISSRKPLNNTQNILFFLPLVGIAVSLIANIDSLSIIDPFIQVSYLVAGGIGNLYVLLGAHLPIFIGALLIAFLGLKGWRRTAILLLGVEALLSIGYLYLRFYVFPPADISFLQKYISVLTLMTLIASILLIVNKKGGSALVRLSGLTFLLATIFSYVTEGTINWLWVPYIWRNLINLALYAIGWITLAMGVINERSNKA